VSKPLNELQPTILWRHFDALVRTPRPSKKETAVCDHVRKWAKEQGFEARTDDAGSVVVVVPATKGHEQAATVVLQGHLDIVCEKHSDVEFDFDTQPIDAYVDGDWVTARGTTLGADNGIGVAAAMAAAEDDTVVHGPLELLFTIDEETGMTGAKALQTDFINGRRMINLDSEEDGALFVGCSGGANSALSLPITRGPVPAGAKAFELRVAGLRGGHSGLDIHQNRGNALKILVATLQAMSGAVADGALALANLSAGDKPNAIPREAEATIWLAAAALPQAQAAVATALQAAAQHYGPVAPELTIELQPSSESPAGAGLDGAGLDGPSLQRLVAFVRALPDGVCAMSRDLPGLVETSTNLATGRTGADEASFVTSSRSSVTAALDEVREQLRACATLAGAEIELQPGYPGWQPNMSSPLLGAAREVFREVFSEDAKITAIHAGLECGLIGERIPDMDMLSFGPEIENAHSPDERVNIPSTGRCYQFLKALLERLAD